MSKREVEVAPHQVEAKLTALLHEYEALSTEKQIHKQAIRNIHVYLASLISVGISLLAFVGLPVDGDSSPETMQVIGNILLAALAPGTLIVCAFGVNDFYQVYVMSRQLASVERRVNELIGRFGRQSGVPAMSWEGTVCPVVFGGKAITWYTAKGRKKRTKLLRPALAGDALAVLYLVPLLVFATRRSYSWLVMTVGVPFAVAYAVLATSSFLIVIFYFGYAVRASYFDGPLDAVFGRLATRKYVGDLGAEGERETD